LTSRLAGWAAFASAWAYGMVVSTAATTSSKAVVMLMLMGAGVTLVAQRIARAVGLRRSARELASEVTTTDDVTALANEIRNQDVPERIQDQIIARFEANASTELANQLRQELQGNGEA
jgi:hypothetical protein